MSPTALARQTSVLDSYVEIPLPWNITTVSIAVKSLVYKQIVRPTLEHAEGAWDSLGKTAEKQLEAVQRRAKTCLIHNFGYTDRKISTTELFRQLNLEAGTTSCRPNCLTSTNWRRVMPFTLIYEEQIRRHQGNTKFNIRSTKQTHYTISVQVGHNS